MIFNRFDGVQDSLNVTLFIRLSVSRASARTRERYARDSSDDLVPKTKMNKQTKKDMSVDTYLVPKTKRSR